MAGDKVVEMRATEVPGMRIIFQGPISPDGLGVSFDVAVDATIDRPELDLLLDTVAGARRRQAAVEELPLVRQNLRAKTEQLKTARREKADHEARMAAREAALSNRRRVPVPANMQDQTNLQQHVNTILQIEEQIELCKVRIPYLEAIIAGDDPPDPLAAAAANDRMAAE